MRYVVVLLVLVLGCGTSANTESAGCQPFTKFLATQVMVTDTEVLWQMTFAKLEPGYTFNLTGFPQGQLEYRWQVLTFVDGNELTPPLTARVENIAGGTEVVAPIGQVTANEFLAPPELVTTLGVQVDQEHSTITLTAQRNWDARLDALNQDSLFRFSSYHDNVYEFCEDTQDARL